MAGPRIVDIVDATSFALVPPCADPRFDHRTCDYWEDADRGSRDARQAWLTPPAQPSVPRQPPPDNPFAPVSGGLDRRRDALAAFLADDAAEDEPAAPLDPAGDEGPFGTPAWNPFAPALEPRTRAPGGQPRKLALLSRGEAVFGSYARVAMDGERAVAYAQFGPLSAYPRAQRLRELYPQLPAAPLPAVITCIATTADARDQGHAKHLIDDVCAELARRGFSAIEVYPDLTQSPEATSASTPRFWRACGFSLVVADERFPVLRRELG